MEQKETLVKTLCIVPLATDPAEIREAALTITQGQTRVTATTTIDLGDTQAETRLLIHLIEVHIEAVRQAATVQLTQTSRLRAYRTVKKDVSAITILATLSLSSEAIDIFLFFSFSVRRKLHSAVKTRCKQFFFSFKVNDVIALVISLPSWTCITRLQYSATS